MSSRANKRGPSALTTTYLIGYNVASKAGWAYILYLSYLHLTSQTLNKPVPALTSLASASVQKAITYLPPAIQPSSTGGLTGQGILNTVFSFIPKQALPYVARAKSLYGEVGTEVAFVQSFAIIEVLHVLLGLVQSPLMTTAMQVASRLWLVWGIVERFPETKSSPLYATMVVAWSLAEIIRYTSYAFALGGMKPYPLQWLRYTAFWILYPVGAGSEAFVMFSTLPALDKIGTDAWTTDDYVRGASFVLWWPGLFLMMSYMAGQRRKVLGRSSKGKAKAE